MIFKKFYPKARQIFPTGQFIKFAMVGAVGLLLDIAVVYSTRRFVGLYVAGIIAYFIAASSNWFFNHLWTFKKNRQRLPLHTQWLRFLILNFIGFILNRGCYFYLITFFAIAYRHPVLAILAGVAAGTFSNFFFSKKFVFS